MSYANNYSSEGTLQGEKTITFPWKPREVQIINDSGSQNLQYKFNPSEDFRTLKPYETSTLYNVSLRTIIISGTGVPYRIWGMG